FQRNGDDSCYFGSGNFLHNALTSRRTFFTNFGLEITSLIQVAICFISFSFMPRVVMAGVPMRIPEGLNGGAGSYGMLFLLIVIPASSSKSAASAPPIFLFRKSMSNKWLSVPPLNKVNPYLVSSCASALAFFTICLAYVLNAGVAASFKQTAIAAMEFS